MQVGRFAYPKNGIENVSVVSSVSFTFQWHMAALQPCNSTYPQFHTEAYKSDKKMGYALLDFVFPLETLG